MLPVRQVVCSVSGVAQQHNQQFGTRLLTYDWMLPVITVLMAHTLLQIVWKRPTRDAWTNTQRA